MKIIELTIEQRFKLKEYREKYIKIGLNTDRIDKKKCTEDINLFYEKILKRKKPRKVVICKSPKQAWRLLCYYKLKKTTLTKKSRQQIQQEIYQELWQEVQQEVRQEVQQEVRQEVQREIYQEVRQEVQREIYQELWQQVQQ